ncbi:MAG: radical SAM protein, partial [Candidatus Marinimicrobia bacterium CG_4_9_14_3_um_filter_48_9]
MTNGVRYSQAVYDGLVNGTMQWVCTSVDAGTPSTYFKMKARDRFSQVLENLARYAHAGQQGGGRLAIKYIFTADNCGDDDILGFLYAC